MKIKVLIAALLGLITVNAYAQKGELSNANEAYAKYDGLARANYTLAKPSLMEAKTSIDKATVHPKTSGLAQTYALRAAIYASLALKDTVEATSAVSYATAQEALKKAKELDTKNEFKQLEEHANLEMAQLQLNKGVKAYQEKKYDEAYKAFNAEQQLIPDDTTAMLYTAVSAANAKNYQAAISNYNKLLTTKYLAKEKIYADMPVLYLLNKDTTGAIKAASEGITAYPNNTSLRKQEIEVNLQAGQQNNLIEKIDAAIKNDPNNKALYYYQGITYSQIAEKIGKDLMKLKKAEKKAAGAKPGVKAVPNPQITKWSQERFDAFNKAGELYKKAIAIDANYFEALLNLGYVIITPAIDIYNDAQQLPVDKAKEYDATMAKATAQFELAKPYLLKAVELKPKSKEALQNLKTYYLGKKDTNNANATQKQIDALN